LISWPVVIAILAACLAVFYVLFPDDFRFVERLANDNKPREALARLRRIPTVERDRSRLRYDLLSLQFQGELLKSDGDHAGESLALLDEALGSGKRHGWQQPFIMELTAIVSLSGSPGACFEKLKNEPIPVPAQAAIAEALTERALALDQPALAATIYSEFARRSAPTEQTTAKLVRLWRMTGRPDKAVEAIRAFDVQVQAQAGGLLFVSPQLYELEIRMLREIGRNAEAFELLRKQFRVAGDSSAARPLLKPLMETAYASGRIKELISDYESALLSEPNDAELLAGYGELLASAGELAKAQQVYARLVALHGDDDKLRLRFAEISEWSGKPSVAFEAYLPLGRHGEAHALDRLIDLNNGLFRLPEVVEALGRAVPVPGRPDLTLVYTRDLILLGHYKEAETWFNVWLKEHPRDYNVWIEVGVLHRSLDEFEEAVNDFVNAERVRPNDLTAGLALAELMSGMGRYDEALKRYAAVAGAHRFPRAIADYELLAEALGDLPQEAAALQLLVDSIPSAGPENFTKLAELYDLLDRPADQLQTLRNGLARYSQDPELVYQTAACLGEQRLWREALATLGSHPGLHTEAKVIVLNLSLLVSAHRVRDAKAFLSSVRKPAGAAQLEKGEQPLEIGRIAAAEKAFWSLIKPRPEQPQTQVERSANKAFRSSME
jgi:tetratricopeptide (TPR) repeat protein